MTDLAASLHRIEMALRNLSNEVLGCVEIARPCIGNTNAACLIQRANETVAAIADVEVLRQSSIAVPAGDLAAQPDELERYAVLDHLGNKVIRLDVARHFVAVARALAETSEASERGEPDRGPWRADRDGRIWSDDFTHDVILDINGDFASPEQKISYAKSLAARLNASPSVAATDGVPVGQLGDSGSATTAKYPPPSPLTPGEREAVMALIDTLDKGFALSVQDEGGSYIADVGAPILADALRTLLRLAERAGGGTVKLLADKYHELLLAVTQKWPDESRHATALRYIRERESASRTSGVASAAPSPGDERPTGRGDANA